MKVAVIGGGPAGMTAAIFAASGGADVTIFEKNEKLGKKIYITGKGRCNMTNNCTPKEFAENVVTNQKFILGAINKFTPQDAMALMEQNGTPMVTQRGNRVFPASDKASDVTKAFQRMLANSGVKIKLNTQVSDIIIADDGSDLLKFGIVSNTISDIVYFDRLIISTGGVSYSFTGSTGDGYRYAKKLGHKVVAAKPALCKILCKGAGDLEGLSLKNVEVSVTDGNGKTLASQFGEMLFTKDGVSGPAVLTLSGTVNKFPARCKAVAIDLKPALSAETLDARIVRDFSERMNKDFRNALDGLLPMRLCELVVKRSGIDPYKKVNRVTAAERAKVAEIVKNLTFPFVGLDSVEASIVTSGGVDVSEVNPSTMESKKVAGLYFAGEVLDVDALTGGFNIQIAMSTGYVAGVSSAKESAK